jgi:eukaryotic-like serine/threonine-protein kinase
LASEPVSAQRESRIYVLRRFVARNRWPIAVTGLLAITISAAAIVSTSQAVAARAQAQRATAAIGQQDAVRELYVEAMNTLASKAAAEPDSLRQPNAVSHALWQMMKEMLPRYHDRPPQTQALLQAVMLQLSYTGDFEGSLEVGQQLLDHMKRHGTEAWIVIDTHAAVARNLSQLGRDAESQAVLREALAWAPEANDSAAERSRLNVASELGGDLMSEGRLEEAKALLHEVEDKTRDRYSDYRERADNLHRLAQFYFGVDDRRALQYARLAHDVLIASGSANRDSLLDSHGKMGVVMMANGLNQEAEQALAEAHRLSVDTYGRADRDTVRNLGRWTQALAAQGKYDAARQILTTEQDALARLHGEDAERARVAIRARQAELELAYGDVDNALLLISNRPDEVLSAAVGMDRITLVTQEAKVLLLAGRIDDALRRATLALDALDPRQRTLVPFPPYLVRRRSPA